MRRIWLALAVRRCIGQASVLWDTADSSEMRINLVNSVHLPATCGTQPTTQSEDVFLRALSSPLVQGALHLANFDADVFIECLPQHGLSGAACIRAQAACSWHP